MAPTEDPRGGPTDGYPAWWGWVADLYVLACYGGVVFLLWELGRRALRGRQ